MGDIKESVDIDNPVLIYSNDKSKSLLAEMSVTPDGLQVKASFYPPPSNVPPLSPEKVKSGLEAHGIQFGILTETIKQELQKVEISKHSVLNVIIAKGQPPVDEEPEHYELLEKFKNYKYGVNFDTGRIDWSQIDSFIFVEYKEPIARRVPENAGKNGRNVYNKPIPFAIKAPRMYSAGSSVFPHEKGLFARKSGRIVITDAGVIDIVELLILEDGVDIRTGNIDFPGDILLLGKISEGFRVSAEGSIVSSEVIDASEIMCKKT
nr:flagellar assembly protein A [Brucepastera parasyntrophica]